jgi:GTPase SAR1 family protein
MLLQPEFKTVLLGGFTVEKTSIIARYVVGFFFESYCPTIGAAYESKDFTLEGAARSLSIWDSCPRKVSIFNTHR